MLARTDAFAAAAQHGLYDTYLPFGTEPSRVWWENDFSLTSESRETYRTASMMDLLGDIDMPTLVTAEATDQRCPAPQAQQSYVGLRKRGVEAKLVRYPAPGHPWGSPDVATHRL
jgi:dipeptidyl aminopeptidase/acylaminoacyl peptidase